MSALLSTLRGRAQVSPRWLTVLIVLGLLLLELILPVRLAQRGITSIALMVALALAVVVLPRPWLGLALLLAYGPFAAAVRFAGASNYVALAKDVFALAVVGVWLVNVLWSRRRLERSPLDVLLVLYFALAVIQALRAPSLLRGVLALKVLFTYVPIYFLVYHNPPRSRRQLQVVIGLVLVVSAVTALYGLYQYQNLPYLPRTVQIEGEEFYLSHRAGQLRILSTFTHSTVFSLYLSLMIPLGVSLLPSVRGRWRLALLVILALLVAVLPLTLSRVGWIGLGVGLLTLALLAWRGSLRVLAILTLVFGFLALFYLSPQSVQETLGWSFTSEDESFVVRSNLIYWAYVMIFREFPQGCGLGTLPDSADLVSRLTHTYEPPYICYYQGVPVNGADTVALAIGVQLGALGYVLYLLIHGVIWWQGFRAYRRVREPFLKTLATGLLAYLAVMTFSNFFSGGLQAYPVVDLYFWFFMGLLLSLERIEKHGSQR